MTRVIWKEEDEVDGHLIGPVFVIDGEVGQDDLPRTAERRALGRPYQTECECGGYNERRDRSTARNEWGYPLCPDCGNELPPQWVSENEAHTLAKRHGVELETS